MTRVAFALASAALLLTSACDSCGAKQPSKTAEATAPGAASAAHPVGVLEGTVRLAPATELPELTPEMMYMQVLQQKTPMPPPEGCTPAKQTDRRPSQLGPDNTLSSIFVVASDFKTPVSRPPKVHEVKITDCRLTPMIVGAMRGDTLRLTNDSDYPFMPQLGGTTYFETIIKGQERLHTLQALGVQTVLCGFTAQCGRTDVITVSHPLYALTDRSGRFRIEGVPANESFHLNAWSPLFQASVQTIKLAPGETKRVDFVLTPEARFTPSGQAEAQRREADANQPVPPGTRPE